jgi:undecaprenyl-diphosphatase
MVQEIDYSIIEFLNISSQSHYWVVRAASFISNNDLFKGIAIVTLLWYVWLKDVGKVRDNNIFILRTVVGAVLAILIGRLAQNYLPMRLRPMHNPDINFVMPYEALENVLGDWSSFPSDHAVLFFALSAAIWSKNRAIGLVAFAWSLIVICFPRVYLGFHYPTDIIAGILLGVGIMAVCLKVRLPAILWTSLEWVQNRYVGGLYAGIFFFSLQIATLFDSMRKLGKAVKMFLALIGLSI